LFAKPALFLSDISVQMMLSYLRCLVCVSVISKIQPCLILWCLLCKLLSSCSHLEDYVMSSLWSIIYYWCICHLDFFHWAGRWTLRDSWQDEWNQRFCNDKDTRAICAKSHLYLFNSISSGLLCSSNFVITFWNRKPFDFIILYKLLNVDDQSY
jgi:hypothetical protein